MFSAYYLDPTYGWVATHRLPENDAVKVCLAYREYHYDCPVALVPNGESPRPYFELAQRMALA